jgi:hypothetical protein
MAVRDRKAYHQRLHLRWALEKQRFPLAWSENRICIWHGVWLMAYGTYCFWGSLYCTSPVSGASIFFRHSAQ